MKLLYEILATGTSIIGLVFGILGNLLVIICVASNKKLQNEHNVIIASLAVSDFLVSLIVNAEFIVFAFMPVEWHEWIEADMVLCNILGTICALGCFTSIFSITAVATNRYVAIVKGQTLYKRLYGKKRVCFHIIAIWSVSLIYDSISYFYGGHVYNRDQTSLCLYNFLSPVVNGIIMGSTFICFFIVGFFYISIYRHVRRSAERVKKQQAESMKFLSPTESPPTTTNGFKRNSNASVSAVEKRRDYKLSPKAKRERLKGKQGSGESIIRKSMAAERRLAIMAFTIFVTFLFGWALWVTASIVNNIINNVPDGVLYVALIMAHFSSSVNPIIYGIVNKNFRAAYKKVFRRILFLKPIQDDAETTGPLSQRRASNVSAVVQSSPKELHENL